MGFINQKMQKTVEKLPIFTIFLMFSGPYRSEKSVDFSWYKAYFFNLASFWPIFGMILDKNVPFLDVNAEMGLIFLGCFLTIFIVFWPPCKSPYLIFWILQIQPFFSVFRPLRGECRTLLGQKWVIFDRFGSFLGPSGAFFGHFSGAIFCILASFLVNFGLPGGSAVRSCWLFSHFLGWKGSFLPPKLRGLWGFF